MVVPNFFFFLERETLNFGGFEEADFKFDNSFIKFQFSYIVLITNKTVSVTNLIFFITRNFAFYQFGRYSCQT